MRSLCLQDWPGVSFQLLHVLTRQPLQRSPAVNGLLKYSTERSGQHVQELLSHGTAAHMRSTTHESNSQAG